MENIQLNTPGALHPRQPQNTAKASVPGNINQQFEDLSNSERYTNRLEKLTESRTTHHQEILRTLFEEFVQVNSEEENTPHGKGDSKLLS